MSKCFRLLFKQLSCVGLTLGSILLGGMNTAEAAAAGDCSMQLSRSVIDYGLLPAKTISGSLDVALRDVTLIVRCQHPGTLTLVVDGPEASGHTSWSLNSLQLRIDDVQLDRRPATSRVISRQHPAQAGESLRLGDHIVIEQDGAAAIGKDLTLRMTLRPIRHAVTDGVEMSGTVRLRLL